MDTNIHSNYAAEELQGQLAEELESELAGLRLHHDRLLAQRRQHEEEGYSRACAELKEEFAERLEGERARAGEELLQEKARLRQEAEKEASSIREELTVKDTLALADLHKMLALDRRRASLLAIEDAVKAAECVRSQTGAILQDELRREIEGMQATHAIRREEKMAEERSAHSAELLQLEMDLQDEHRRTADRIRADMQRAADAERSRIETEAEAEATLMAAQVKAASLQRLDNERLQIEEAEQHSRELLASRHKQVLLERDAQLQQLEKQWIEEDERAVGEVRERLSQESHRKSAAVAEELRQLASIPTEVLLGDFTRWLASSAQELVGVVAAAKIDEIARWEREGDEAEAAAVTAVEAEIASENEERVRRLVKDCALRREEAVALIQAEVKGEMHKQRVRLDAEHAARLSAALEEARAKLAAQAREGEGRAVAAENEKTEQEVKAARKDGEEEMRAALMEASRGFEQSLQAELVQLHTATTAAHDAALQGRREELTRARDAQLERARSEAASKTSKQLQALQEQMADERERRIQAMQRSCVAELERRSLEVDVMAQADLERALNECRVQAGLAHDAALADVKSSSQAEIEGAVSELREEARAKLDQAVLDARARYDAERVAAVEALKMQRSAELEATLAATRREFDEAREKQVQELKGKAGEELAAALEALRSDKTAECVAALEAVREEAEKVRERELQALDEQMARRKDEAISAVEAECRARMVQETDEMNEAFAASRDETLRALQVELQGDLQVQMENKQLRAELELSRQLSALRSECVADLERCKALVQSRNSRAAQKLISVLRLKHRKESDAHTAAGDRNARRQNDEAIRELRDEWSELRRLVRELLDAALTDSGARRNSQEVGLEDMVGMRIQLETAIRQVDELQGCLGLVAAQAASPGAGAQVLSSQRGVTNSLTPESGHVGSKPLQPLQCSASPALSGQRRGQVRRALSFSATKPDDPQPGRLSAAETQRSQDCKVSDSACAIEVQDECDLSMRSTLPSDTPCKSTASSTASSTPAGRHIYGDLSPAWHAKYGDLSPIKHSRPTLTRKAVSDSTYSLDDVGGGAASKARRGRDESDDADSEDSLDESPHGGEAKAAGGKAKKGLRPKVLDKHQQSGSPSQVRPIIRRSLHLYAPLFARTDLVLCRRGTGCYFRCCAAAARVEA